MANLILGMGKKRRLLYLKSASEQDWAAFAQTADFEVQKLAIVLGVSTRHCERLVRARFDLSPREFLLRQRMAAACELLPKADSIKETSFQLGYTHPTIFNRHFKQFFGITPTQYLMSPRV